MIFKSIRSANMNATSSGNNRNDKRRYNDVAKKKKKVWRVEAGGFKLWHPGFELV